MSKSVYDSIPATPMKKRTKALIYIYYKEQDFQEQSPIKL